MSPIVTFLSFLLLTVVIASLDSKEAIRTREFGTQKPHEASTADFSTGKAIVAYLTYVSEMW